MSPVMTIGSPEARSEQSFSTAGLVAFDTLEEAGDGKDSRLYVRREALRNDAKLLKLILKLIGICLSRARSN